MQRYSRGSRVALSSYEYLRRLSADRWAWEFLRRNRAFRRDAAFRPPIDVSAAPLARPGVRFRRAHAPQSLAGRWGLVFMPDPERNGYEEDVIWSRHAFPDQTEIVCSPCASDRRCEVLEHILAACDVTHVTDPIGREFLILRRAGRALQIRCTGVSLLGLDPVRVKFAISCVRSYERRVKLQRAAIEFYNAAPCRSDPEWTKTTEVLRNALIAIDCLDLQMSRRETAAVLHGAEKVQAEWDGPALKHSIRYLVKKGEALRGGGYLTELLGLQTGAKPPHMHLSGRACNEQSGSLG